MTLYALYLFLSTVMLINLLIAMMSSTYDTIQVNVDVEWKAEWAIMVKFLSREQSMLEFSPPLNLVFVPYWICKKIYRWRQSMRQVRHVYDRSLPSSQGGVLKFSPVEAEGVHPTSGCACGILSCLNNCGSVLAGARRVYERRDALGRGVARGAAGGPGRR